VNLTQGEIHTSETGKISPGVHVLARKSSPLRNKEQLAGRLPTIQITMSLFGIC
jgi:hypothetical protein